MHNSYVAIITCYTEILEALSSSSPVSVMTMEFTTNTVSATVSQQCGRSTIVHHTSSVSSVKNTTTSGSGVTQLQKGVLFVKC